MVVEAMGVRKTNQTSNSTRIARNVQACMQAEGFRVTAKTRASCIAVASGKQSADQLVKARLAAYTVKK